MGDPYYRYWADLYDATARGTEGDVDFYVGLAREADGLVIELGAGTGRVAIPCALAGARVLGIDLEPAMLEVARRKAGEADIEDRLTLVEGDMRAFQAPEPAALVTIPFRAFLHNLTVEDQRATLESCFRALRPGGRLALNVFNPDLSLIARWMSKGPRHWEPATKPPGDVEAHTEYQPTAQISTTQLRVRGADGRWQRTSHTLRYVHRFEMEHLLRLAGFEIEAVFGGCDRSELQEGSPELVWIGRRPQ